VGRPPPVFPRTKGGQPVDWKLELIVVPVSDVDRAKAFYMDQAGFHLDVDHSAGEDFRVVQLTPPGSACSIALMRNEEAPGSIKGLQLVVPDIEAAREELAGRGVDISEVFHFEEGQQRPGPDPERADFNSFLSFSDPDGTGWMVQEYRRAGAGGGYPQRAEARRRRGRDPRRWNWLRILNYYPHANFRRKAAGQRGDMVNKS
jgi:predicted enzyme related to lactoylglutathione lyase